MKKIAQFLTLCSFVSLFCAKGWANDTATTPQIPYCNKDDGCQAYINYEANIVGSTCSITTGDDMTTKLDDITIDKFLEGAGSMGSDTKTNQKVLDITIECPPQTKITGYISQSGVTRYNNINTDGEDILVPTNEAGVNTGAGFRLYQKGKSTPIRLGQAHPFTIKERKNVATTADVPATAAEPHTMTLEVRYANRTGTITPGRLEAQAKLHLSYD